MVLDSTYLEMDMTRETYTCLTRIRFLRRAMPRLSAGCCVVLESADVENMLYCFIVFDLPEGSIMMQGAFANMDVVSGTGENQSTR